MKIQISRHAEQRMRERCGLNKKSIERMANKAWENGIKSYETIGNLNKWVTMVYFRRKCANNVRLYGDKAYIFCENVLVTVLQIPHRLVKDMDCMIRR